jgi:hypothetical protein
VKLPLTWRARAEPLAPLAAAALGDAAARLCGALLERSDEALAKLQGVAGQAILAVTGASDDLPWVDGIVYLGRDPEAAALLVPTHLRPDLPLALVERALRTEHPHAGAPLLVLANPTRLVSLAGARPMERSALQRWRAEAR